MKDILERINLIIPDEQESINEKDGYEAFFKKKLKDWGIDTPDELSAADQKKFFAEIKREWKK